MRTLASVWPSLAQKRPYVWAELTSHVFYGVVAPQKLCDLALRQMPASNLQGNKPSSTETKSFQRRPGGVEPEDLLRVSIKKCVGLQLLQLFAVAAYESETCNLRFCTFATDARAPQCNLAENIPSSSGPLQTLPSRRTSAVITLSCTWRIFLLEESIKLGSPRVAAEAENAECRRGQSAPLQRMGWP